MGKNNNKAFCAELETLSRVDVTASERQLVEKTLGKGAVKYKLDSAGFYHLFKALAEEKSQLSGSRR